MVKVANGTCVLKYLAGDIVPGVPDCVPVATYVVPIVHDVPHAPGVAALLVVHVVPNITLCLMCRT